MKFSVPLFFRRPTAVLSRRVVLVFLLLGLIVNGWLFWQGWTQWADQILPADRVNAKQLRVNASQRQTLEQNLQSYHEPATPPAVPSIQFEITTR